LSLVWILAADLGHPRAHHSPLRRDCAEYDHPGLGLIEREVVGTKASRYAENRSVLVGAIHQQSDEQAADYVSSAVCRAPLINLRTACMSWRLFSE
jgi:hypothetical protein